VIDDANTIMGRQAYAAVPVVACAPVVGERLVATLDVPVPRSLPAGRATAVFCYGTCFHPHQDVAELALLVDGERHRVAAARMPRPDAFAALHPDGRPSREDPELRSYRSGFWAIVPVAAHRDGAPPVTLELAARLESGAEAVAPLARIEIGESPPRPAPGRPAGAGLIAICMATYEPDPELFRAQVASLRAQTHREWVCVISDDCSSAERFAEIEAAVAGDARFTISRSERRLGFYRNFERAITLAPEAELLALCDQDDRWHPDKLAALRAALGAATLAYSDQRLVDAGGRVVRETLWQRRRNNHSDLASLLVANSITGAATLFRRDVVELALPFPDTPGFQFHDHWLGLVALAAGDVAYVERPLYDYVQHAGAVFGDVVFGRERRGRLGPRAYLRRARGAYFLGYLARAMQAQVLLLRCGPRLTAQKRRALRRFVAAERSPTAFAWLAARSLRVLAGRNETLASETELVSGIAWRRLQPLLAAGARTPGRRLCDASFPEPLSFEQRRLRRWRARP
jgi:glycosyltransferase involved in cell wall biosynthesis